MPPIWLTMLKTSAGLLLKKLQNITIDNYALRKAGERAMKGEDLASQSSIHHLVKKELEKLASSDHISPELQSDMSRSWLRQGENVELFVEVLIAKAGNLSEISKQAEERLASDYERLTQETRKLASGRVSLAVAYVHGQLNATETGRQALQLAIVHWTAAHMSGLSNPEQHQFPSDADLTRMKAMASTLLEAGKRSWKMPQFVAPLTLEAQVRQDEHEPSPTNSSELTSAIEAGYSLVLFGPGGIGKTTFLLDLSTSCMNVGRRIPLYVDAAVWARTNASLIEYLASQPAAQVNNVTSVELSKLAEAGRLVIMLNGWNEMSASSKLVCRDGLIQLTTTADALSVVVVSRTSSDTPVLLNVKRVEVRGLTWQGQAAVIRSELGDDGAAPLIDLLAKNSRLRHAARNPLILRGLIAQANKGAVAYSCVFDLLGAAVQAFEEDAQRTFVLTVLPVDGHQSVYLEELACLLTQQMTTNCSRDNALQAILFAATSLVERQLIGELPNLAAVLDVLVSHHLLHLENGVVRFAHQRFQEYFAAIRLLRECTEKGLPPIILRTSANHPAWNESLRLVAGKLKGEGCVTDGRVRMVKTAAEIDLGLACDLSGICALSDADDSRLYDHIVERVNELAASSLEEVRDLGVAYQIASGLPAFAENLWQLIESENHQIRLRSYRLNGSAISLCQLGAGANQRIASWSPEHRVELVHEIADNADNYEFLVGLAQSEPDPVVRAATISTLFWHFPASDVALQAWLDAPIEVQTEHSIVGYIQYALEEGYAGDAVRERLKIIVDKDTSHSTQLQLAQFFPNEVGPRVLDVIFERLGDGERHRNDAPLVAIARVHAPKHLLDLARELAVQAQVVPDWVCEFLREASVEVMTEVFERAWAILQGADFKKLRGEILGTLANRDQIVRSVVFMLQKEGATFGALSEIDRERYTQLGYLLAHASGDYLLDVVMQFGQAASYNEAAVLLKMVLHRIGLDDGCDRATNLWLPTVEEVRQLVDLFAEKEETAEVPQDTVRVYLCSIAGHVAPAEFGAFLMETYRRHLDAWSIFREKINQWSKRTTSIRPHNPQWGHNLGAALRKWGPDALPGLLELMDHPSAMESIPDDIARIVSLPWTIKRERLFSSVSADIQEGEQRRSLGCEFRQPDDKFQHWTDEAAKVLGQKLNELVTAHLEKKSSVEKWNTREAEYSVGRLAETVARIPSTGSIVPVQCALASGLMNVFGTVGAMRGLLRQGLNNFDSAVVVQLDALYEQEACAKWHDDSTRYTMKEMSELMFYLVPTLQLSKPMGHYLLLWRQFSHSNEVIRHLGSMHSEAAWSGLLELGRELAEKGRPPEELAPALISALTPQHLTEFISLVADGTLFAWCDSGWTLEQHAPKVAAVLGEATDQVEAFVDACRHNQSPLSDALVCEVLINIKGSDRLRQSYLLNALDAGRADHPNMPTYQILRGMFVHHESIGGTHYEVTPKSNNEMRAQIYARAKGAGPIADSCRRLLASIECGRREDGRPDDEPRHPAPEDDMTWTDVLLVRN